MLTVEKVIKLLGAQNLTSSLSAGDREISGAMSCDLLSFVMGNGQAGMAWVTLQTHLNVIAVSALLETACVIICEGMKVEDAVLEKAADENVAVIATDKSAYECCALLYGEGVGPVKRK